MMNGLVNHNIHNKDENSVTVAMQRITLMGPKYADRIWHLNTQILYRRIEGQLVLVAILYILHCHNSVL